MESSKNRDSYFAHRKTKDGDKCSGTKGIDYVNPPLSLLEFVKKTCDSLGFNSVASICSRHKDLFD
jgi:hypothetical protein